jgi:hypothetical protein
VSDFLSRVAARAVGRPPLAAPRLPALFEEPGAADAGAGLEVVEEEFVASAGTALRGDDARAASGVAAASPLERDARGRAREVDEPALRPGALPAAAPGSAETGTRPVEPVAVPVTVPAHVTPEREPREPAPPASVSREHPEAPPPVPATEAALPGRAPAVVAVPSPRAPEPGAAATAPTAAAARAEQPSTVQIRIGRLEVRANLQEAQRPQRSSRERAAAPPSLSLSDYLRGRREAG